MHFLDRTDAGVQLGRLLGAYRHTPAVVLGLPRGGVPVAYEVATMLELPLDIFVVRKLGAPLQPEFGMGAVAEGGVRFLDERIVQAVGASPAEVEAITARERAEVERRVLKWRGRRPMLPVKGKTVIVVDDGIATGGTVRAALQALRAKEPESIVLAVPVASPSTLRELASSADQIVCVQQPYLSSIGEWYHDFTQVPDDAVSVILEQARVPSAPVSERSL